MREGKHSTAGNILHTSTKSESERFPLLKNRDQGAIENSKQTSPETPTSLFVPRGKKRPKGRKGRKSKEFETGARKDSKSFRHT